MSHGPSSKPPSGTDGREAPRKGPSRPSRRRTWRPARLLRFGTVEEIVAGGGGKLSPAVDGDGRKPPAFN